jgi:hypothetical protein
MTSFQVPTSHFQLNEVRFNNGSIQIAQYWNRQTRKEDFAEDFFDCNSFERKAIEISALMIPNMIDQVKLGNDIEIHIIMFLQSIHLKVLI